MKITIRPYSPDDLIHIITLFRNTIHAVNSKDYTPEQLNAWAPQNIDAERWGARLLEHYTVVAECDTVICGFGDLHENGYLDHLFTHKDYQGMGVATKIVNAIETQAKITGVAKIVVHASVTAKSFFLQKDYSVVNPQEVHYNGEVFTNYVMQKNL